MLKFKEISRAYDVLKFHALVCNTACSEDYEQSIPIKIFCESLQPFLLLLLDGQVLLSFNLCLE